MRSNIMYSNKRYYIHRENVGGIRFYTMYAPIFNDNGDMLAILSAPYTDSGTLVQDRCHLPLDIRHNGILHLADYHSFHDY